MTKKELLNRIKQGSKNGKGAVRSMLAAKRISQSIEVGNLHDDDEITIAMLQEWIDKEPKRWGSLSDSDLQMIGSIIEKKSREEEEA